MLVDRPAYTQRILEFIDSPVIKVITCVRRCGKSTILHLVRDRLLANGVPQGRIHFVNMESLEFEHLRDYRALYEFVRFLEERNSPTDRRTAWKLFLRYGGFPGIHYLPLEDRPVFTYLNSLYSTVVLKDVVNRHDIREPAQLDLKGKRHLELNDKYYMADVGIRHGLIGYSDGDIAGLLENVVYLELRARGYAVSVGKLPRAEIDFIAERGTERRYIQVLYLLATEATVEREFGALERIDNNYPRLVLSLDEMHSEDRRGIAWRNLIDFLLDENG